MLVLFCFLIRPQTWWLHPARRDDLGKTDKNHFVQLSRLDQIRPVLYPKPLVHLSVLLYFFRFRFARHQPWTRLALLVLPLLRVHLRRSPIQQPPPQLAPQQREKRRPPPQRPVLPQVRCVHVQPSQNAFMLANLGVDPLRRVLQCRVGVQDFVAPEVNGELRVLQCQLLERAPHAGGGGGSGGAGRAGRLAAEGVSRDKRDKVLRQRRTLFVERNEADAIGRDELETTNLERNDCTIRRKVREATAPLQFLRGARVRHDPIYRPVRRMANRAQTHSRLERSRSRFVLVHTEPLVLVRPIANHRGVLHRSLVDVVHTGTNLQLWVVLVQRCRQLEALTLLDRERECLICGQHLTLRDLNGEVLRCRVPLRLRPLYHRRVRPREVNHACLQRVREAIQPQHDGVVRSDWDGWLEDHVHHEGRPRVPRIVRERRHAKRAVHDLLRAADRLICDYLLRNRLDPQARVVRHFLPRKPKNPACRGRLDRHLVHLVGGNALPGPQREVEVLVDGVPVGVVLDDVQHLAGGSGHLNGSARKVRVVKKGLARRRLQLRLQERAGETWQRQPNCCSGRQRDVRREFYRYVHCAARVRLVAHRSVRQLGFRELFPYVVYPRRKIEELLGYTGGRYTYLQRRIV
mmetsp:Transcript_2717/g.6330  ORF Transcript_2717/g.6330 Transcript_2717/m.6330 type:complete len:633 (+) Transcript_2717:2644-4542(+)